MSFEKLKISPEVEKGVSVCLTLKEKKPDEFHWGPINCDEITHSEALLIAKFDALKKNFSGKKDDESLFSLDAEARKLLGTTKSPVIEILINEIVALHYEQKRISSNN